MIEKRYTYEGYCRKCSVMLAHYVSIGPKWRARIDCQHDFTEPREAPNFYYMLQQIFIAHSDLVIKGYLLNLITFNKTAGAALQTALSNSAKTMTLKQLETAHRIAAGR